MNYRAGHGRKDALRTGKCHLEHLGVRAEDVMRANVLVLACASLRVRTERARDRVVVLCATDPEESRQGQPENAEEALPDRRHSEALIGNHMQSWAIRGNQRPLRQKALRSSETLSEAIRSNQKQSYAIRRTQTHSEALRSNQTHSEAIRGTQRQSEAVRRSQRHSEALRGSHGALETLTW